ncbi:MAG: FAD-dependent oxidoreductase [Aureispira sp.]|nr:FAD-dependent oxidoreductase [Aureispira sp.]
MEDTIVVVGGGLIGSATAWQMAKTGQKVILLEQQPEEYDKGSSRGESRICRVFSRQHPVFGLVHTRTVALVKELLTFLNAHDPATQHSLSHIYNSSPVTYAHIDIYQTELKTLSKTGGLEYIYGSDMASIKELLGLDIGEEQPSVVFKETNSMTGTLNPKKLISYLHKGIKAKGGEVYYAHQVNSLELTAEGFDIIVNNKTIAASRLMLAAGPYTSSLLQGIYPSISKVINPR